MKKSETETVAKQRNFEKRKRKFQKKKVLEGDEEMEIELCV